MVFWINIHGCQLHPKIVIYVGKQLKNELLLGTVHNNHNHVIAKYIVIHSLCKFVAFWPSPPHLDGSLWGWDLVPPSWIYNLGISTVLT